MLPVVFYNILTLLPVVVFVVFDVFVVVVGAVVVVGPPNAIPDPAQALLPVGHKVRLHGIPVATEKAEQADLWTSKTKGTLYVMLVMHGLPPLSV